MAKHVVNVTFEIDSKTGKSFIVRTYLQHRAGVSPVREVLERIPVAFLLPQGQTPRQDEETLHHVLRNMIGNPV